MIPIQGGILLGAYVLGLGVSELLGILGVSAWMGGYGLLGLGIALSLTVPRRWRTGPRAKTWLIAGLIGLIATAWWQWHVPKPGPQDISLWVPQASQTETQLIAGWVDSSPRLTRSDRIQFWLKAAEVQTPASADIPTTPSSKPSELEPRQVTGRVYVTVPVLQGTGLYPGQLVQISGSLYSPKPALNPGSFDFRAYLARQGGFAGFQGDRVTGLKPASTFWPFNPLSQSITQLRRQIVRVQVRWLNSPAGPLVSSMVLGRRAVDLPYDVQDQFIQAGLAHTLAASGFHVSLLLSVVLGLSQRLGVRSRIGLGVGILLIYVGLTGIQPSVMRAVFMGFGALLGLATQRKVKQYGALLATVVLLLVFNPLWISDLGFQLSVLATLGLLVTVPPLVKRLDWLPPTLAAVVAVPLAAYVWTLPLQLYAFGVVSPYSPFLNILATPFVLLITLGGMLSASVGLIWPTAGSAIAWLLYAPVHGLIQLVTICNQLPGNQFGVGRIGLLAVLAIYSLLSLAWLQPWWQQRRWFVGLLAISIIFVPVGYAQATLQQATVLATADEPALIVQNQGSTLLISTGDRQTLDYGVSPFLKQHGINQIDWAIALPSTKRDQAWSELTTQAPVKSWLTVGSLPKLDTQPQQPLSLKAPTQIGSAHIQLIQEQPSVLQVTLPDQAWLILPQLSLAEQQQLLHQPQRLAAEVLWWPGNDLSSDFLAAVQPQVAIAPHADGNTIKQLMSDRGIQTYWMDHTGAIQWSIAQSSIQARSASPDQKSSALE